MNARWCTACNSPLGFYATGSPSQHASVDFAGHEFRCQDPSCKQFGRATIVPGISRRDIAAGEFDRGSQLQ